jgi:ribonuclease M5
MRKIKLSEAVICEGRYDKIKLSSLLDAEIITLDGFGIFNNTEKRRLIASLAEKRGIITVTDSDSAGAMLRAHINNITKGKGVEHVYIPSVNGKERRKSAPSKEGLLGVEGMEVEVLYKLFERFEKPDYVPPNEVSRERFYSDGYSGTPDAKARREKLAEALKLPRNMSSKALLSAINMLTPLEEYERITEQIK